VPEHATTHLSVIIGFDKNPDTEVPDPFERVQVDSWAVRQPGQTPIHTNNLLGVHAADVFSIQCRSLRTMRMKYYSRSTDTLCQKQTSPSGDEVGYDQIVAFVREVVDCQCPVLASS
jgi:hypothetical protein